MKARLASIGIALGLSGATWAQPAPPVSMTHFANESNFTWSITNADGRNTTIFVRPHTVANISWSATSYVIISGSIPSKPYRQQFPVQISGQTVAIESTGVARQPGGPDTRLVVNQPGNGDMTTCSGAC